VIASPGFTKVRLSLFTHEFTKCFCSFYNFIFVCAISQDQFRDYLFLEAQRRDLRAIIENKSRIILAHATSGYKLVFFFACWSLHYACLENYYFEQFKLVGSFSFLQEDNVIDWQTYHLCYYSHYLIKLTKFIAKSTYGFHNAIINIKSL
jgi:hypothetical protein